MSHPATESISETSNGQPKKGSNPSEAYRSSMTQWPMMAVKKRVSW